MIGFVCLFVICLSVQKSPDLEIQASGWSISAIKESELAESFLIAS